MSDYYIAIPHDDYVVHHGVLGQKWGVRRYQNDDGTLTAEGRARYGSDATSVGRHNMYKQIGRLKNPTETRKVISKIDKEAKRTKEYKRAKAYDDLVNATLTRLKKEHPDAKAAVFDREFVTGMNNAYRAYSNKWQELSMKYIDEISGATLRDMGYKDTKKARDFITSIYDRKLYGGRISKARKAEAKQNRRMERSQRFKNSSERDSARKAVQKSYEDYVDRLKKNR